MQHIDECIKNFDHVSHLLDDSDGVAYDDLIMQSMIPNLHQMSKNVLHDATMFSEDSF